MQWKNAWFCLEVLKKTYLERLWIEIKVARRPPWVRSKPRWTLVRSRPCGHRDSRALKKKTGLLKNNNDFKTCCSIHTIICIFYTHFATRLYIILQTCAKTFGFQELQGSCCTTFGPRFPKVQFPTVPRMNRSVHFLAMCTQWTLKNPPDNNSQYRDSCYFKHISKTHVEILCPVWSLT